MNISHDGTNVRFKTEPKELFEAEKSGTKPNTVRIIDTDEYHQLRKANPKTITIQYQQDIFLRTITNIYETHEVFGKVVVVISWTNEKHHHHSSEKIDTRSPGNHTQSLDDDETVTLVPPIYLSAALIKDLDLYRGTASYEELISRLLQDFAFSYSVPQPLGAHSVPTEQGDHNLRPEELAPDNGFVAIGISKQMFNTLQNSFSGRTMNSVVQELYETYLYKQAEEKGPLHD